MGLRAEPSPAEAGPPEPLPDIVGHDRILAALRPYHETRWSGGVFLFAGPESVGKRLVALRFAMGRVCARQTFLGCQACAECRLFLRGTHPDVNVWEPPPGRNHPLESVHTFRSKVAFRPLRGPHKIFVWDRAERMRQEAANALLKTLEEPPQDTLILLVADRLYRVLPTIRSRSRIFRFGLVDEQVLLARLVEDRALPESEARWVVRMSGGRPGLAFRPEGYWRFQRELRQRVLTWFEAYLTEPLHGWAGFMDLDVRDLVPRARELFGVNAPVYTRDGWVWSRWWVEQILRHAITLMRDLVFLHTQVPELMVSFDLRPKLERLARALPLSWMLGRLQAWSQFLYDMGIYQFQGVWHIPALLWPWPRIQP